MAGSFSCPNRKCLFLRYPLQSQKAPRRADSYGEDRPTSGTFAFGSRQLLTVSVGYSLGLAKDKVVKVRPGCHFGFFPYSIADPGTTGG